MNAIDKFVQQANTWLAREVDRRIKEMIPVNWKQVVLNAEATIKGLDARVRELQAQLDILEAICDERTRLLHVVPPCPVHGHNCVPYAIEWVQERKKERAKKLERAAKRKKL